MGLMLATVAWVTPASAQLIPGPSPQTLVAEKDVKIDGDARVMGSVHANGKVEVKEDATVLGDVSAGDEIKNDGVILGEQTEGAPDVILQDFDADDLRGMADRSFDDDHLFGDEVVDDIVFVDGKATLEGPVTGGGMILAADDIIVDTAFVDGDLGDPRGPTLVAVKDVKVEKDMGWRGDLLAGKNVKLEDNSRLDGRAFAHDKVEVKKNVHILGDPTDPPPELQKPFVLLEPASDAYRLFVGLAGDEIKIDKDSVVTGNIHSNDKIDLKKDALVDGDASAVGEIQGDGEITGSSDEDAAPQVLPYLPHVSSLQGLADRVFEDDVTFTDATIDDVVFVFGKVKVEGTLRGGGTIIACDKIEFKGDPGAADPEARLSLISYDEIKLDKDWTFRGSLRGGKDIKLEQRNVVHGIAIADHKLELKKETLLTFEDVTPPPDLTPPNLSIQAPTALEILDDPTPEIRLAFDDAESGIDPTSLGLTLNGFDLLLSCAVDEVSAVCEPPPLAEGRYTLLAEVRNGAGLPSAVSFTFSLFYELEDIEPPTLTLVEPLGDPPADERSPSVRLDYADAESGIDLLSFRLRIDDRDVVETCTVTASSALCQPWALATGEHRLDAEVRDLAGNEAFVELEFSITSTQDDSQRPSLEILSPASGTVVDGAAPEVVIVYSDGDSGIDRSSLSVVVDSTDVTADCQVGADGAICPSPALAAGSHRVSVRVSDLEGNGLMARNFFEATVDASDDAGPTAIFVMPGDQPVLADLLETAVVRLNDVGSGLDLKSVNMALDARDITFDCFIGPETRCEIPFLASGVHRLTVQAADMAGNGVVLEHDFEVLGRPADDLPPSLQILAPAAQVGEGPLDVRLSYADRGGAGVDRSSLAVTLDGQPLTCNVRVISANCSLGSLAVGSYRLEAQVADLDGNLATANLDFEAVPEQVPPSINIEAPVGTVMGDARPEIRVRYSDLASGLDLGSFRLLIDGVEATAGCAVGADTALCQPSPLTAGSHQLNVEIRDQRGNVARDGVVIEVEVDLGVEITAPQQGLLTRHETVTLEGVLAQAVDQVVVSGGGADIEAQVAGLSFVAVDVPLIEGSNVLTAVARVGDAVGLATLSVVRDTQPPRLIFRSPIDGSQVASGEIIVTGEVVDGLPGHIDAADPQVTVGGRAAELDHGTFLVESYLLQPGDNRIEATVSDAAGNFASQEIVVRSMPRATGRIEILLGQGQRATAESTLADPLTVRLVDVSGSPLAGRRVSFEVRQGSGRLSAGADDGRRLTVTSNEHGVAAVHFTLGARAGRGNHGVAVTSPGLAAADFWASATVGLPQRIVPVVGGDQTGVRRGAVGREYLQPLLAQVFDSHGNPLAGVPVTFRGVLGGGSFIGGSMVDDGTGAETAILETITDRGGIAAVRYVLGPEEGIGNNVVEATFEGLGESPATFVLSSLEPGPESSTSLSGLVLDNQDQPVPGVTLSAAGRSTTADAEGRFRLLGLPAGWLHLEVEGSTSSRPGTWPHLEFALQTVAGRDNDIGMPILLPRIDVDGGRTVGGSQDVEIPMTGVPGASLTVFANSVTFPDGSTSGELSFTQVLSNKVPMVAPLGSSFALAFTIQPPGVHFDPPAQVRIPNLGMESGEVVDIFSFDHDLGEFVTAGSASVSDDGRFLRSNPGSGIQKSGWGGCVTPPAPPGDVCNPGACTRCVDKRLEPKCDVKCEICTGSGCDPRKIEEITASANNKTEDDKVIVGIGQEVQFRPQNPKGNCSSLSYTWRFGDGEESMDEAPTHEYKTEGDKEIEMVAACDGCPAGGSATDTIKIKVIKLAFEGAFERLDTSSEDMLMVEMEDIDSDGNPDDFFRVLGGVRLRLKLEEHSDLAGKIDELTWKADAGTFYDGFASTAKELMGAGLSGAMLDEVFWQGPWTNGQDHELTVTAELSDDNEVEGNLLVRTRELSRGVSQGDDIAMLQYLLRIYGLSEGNSIGYAGAAVSVDRDFGGKTSKAVRRFKVRDELVPCGTRNSDYKTCINNVSNTVDDATLEALENHWKDFQAAQEAYAMDPKILINDARFVPQWVPATSMVLQNTYTAALHAAAAPGHDYNRLVEEWLRKEGSKGQWGRQIPFRIVLGGADELGSIGFSQITNTNKYGPTTIAGIAALNLYEPEENCRALAAFANSSGQGMDRAFAKTDYTTTAMFTYPHIGATYTDGTLDLLSKALMAYNGGANRLTLRRDPWPVILKNNLPPLATTNFGQRTAIKYALTIQANSGMPDQCWTWTDRVITTGPDDVCDTAVSVVFPDQVIATGPLFPPTIPPPPGPPNQVCVGTANPGEAMLALPLGNDQFQEFSFTFCAADWAAGTSFKAAWEANLPATIP